MIDVVVLAIQKDPNLFFVQQRHHLSKNFPNCWEFVGGKVEKNETALEAIIRESLEEVGLTLTPTCVTFIIESVIGDYNISFFKCKKDFIPKCNLQQNYQWLTVNEIMFLPNFIEIDKPFLPFL